MQRRLGATDAALIVMGGILGSGIFLNPAIVAGYLHNEILCTLLWIAGGAIALLGAGVFAELAARRPYNGGFYAYLRDALHPSVAFVYGWTLLLLAQSGGMAAGTLTFAIYVVPALGLHISTGLLGAGVLALFTGVNLLGVRQGASLQHVFMGLNVAMIAALAAFAFLAPHPAAHAAAMPAVPVAMPGAIGLALVAVLFAYDGWHTSSFINAELRDPGKTLPRALYIGVVAVVVLYLVAQWAFVHGLGLEELAKSATPASDLAARVLGNGGVAIVAALVAVATMSTLAQQILVSPRVYHQMAEDGVFFPWLALVGTRTQVPYIAIAVQGATAIVIALWLNYNQILNYVEYVDFVFFALAAVALLRFRKQDGHAPVSFRMPMQPWSTILFGAISVGVVASVVAGDPKDAAIGLGIMLAGLPVYWMFRRLANQR